MRGEQFLVGSDDWLSSVDRGLDDFARRACAADQFRYNIHIGPGDEIAPVAGSKRVRMQTDGRTGSVQDPSRADSRDLQREAQLAFDLICVVAEQSERAAAHVAETNDAYTDGRHQIPSLLHGFSVAIDDSRELSSTPQPWNLTSAPVAGAVSVLTERVTQSQAVRQHRQARQRHGG